MNNVYLITSTINSGIDLIHPKRRFYQTLRTIRSIRKKDPTSYIILIDNSTLTGEIHSVLQLSVDKYVNISNRRMSNLFSWAKSPGEAYIVLLGLNIIKGLKFDINRIFKICGRYELTDDFNLYFYKDKVGKYVFRNSEPSLERYSHCCERFFHTRIWSVCGTLLDDCIVSMQNTMCSLNREVIDIEHSIYKNIDQSKVIEVERIGLQGYIAPLDIMVYD